ncbi:hypothetical protein DM02DRAFT_732491 [Periconia macrospinosa]|uniref:P-loop containing nucleoside triphosphate hydrolase protein n=1 Tax=Periconia macrospinosa TaxID=97972 RepID=A0A2V1D8P5_9PLEO|nr:hypothetical protein DM02DRAFT_732491 [Periconia macrospinosa]
MPSLNTKNYPYWLDAAIRSGLSSPPTPVLPTLFTSTLQTIGILKPPTSTTLSAFSSFSVKNKRIIIAGLDCAGKSTLLQSHVSVDSSPAHRDITVQIPFIGAKIETVADQRSGNLFHTIDVGGCAPVSYSVFNRAVCAQGDAIVWVVDGCDRDRIVESVEEFKMALGLCERFDERRLGTERVRIFDKFEGVVAVLVSKRDVENSMTMEEIEKYFRALLGRLGDGKWKMFGVTMRSGEGVSEAMKWVAEQLQNDLNAPVDEKTLLTNGRSISADEKSQ